MASRADFGMTSVCAATRFVVLPPAKAPIYPASGTGLTAAKSFSLKGRVNTR
jgi:hypothetical protein